MTVRSIIDDLVNSETEEEAEDGFARLQSVLEAEFANAEKHEAARRQRDGITMMVKEGTTEAAVDDWNATILAAREAEQVGSAE
jgi:secreted Zn-dependent insulinase-like peptidase